MGGVAVVRGSGPVPELTNGDPAAAPARRRGLTDRMPWLRPFAVACFRARRRWQWAVGGTRFARRRSAELPVLVKRHRSLLLRRLGDADMWLQHNKVTNLRIAAARLDGLLIEPGETFSFCRTVGRTTRSKGYLVGMFLSGGEVRPDVGGGICQAANLHNYVDLQVRNDTAVPYQLRVRVGDTYLHGELRAAAMPPFSYHVEAREERFTLHQGQWWRSNEIWRRVIDRRTGNEAADELLKRNRARAMYDPKVTYPDRRPGGRL